MTVYDANDALTKLRCRKVNPAAKFSEPDLRQCCSRAWDHPGPHAAKIHNEREGQPDWEVTWLSLTLS